MSSLKILWVQDDFNGPINGLVSYNGENLWFSKIEKPPMVSSTDIPIPKMVESMNNQSSNSQSKEESVSQQKKEAESDDEWDDPVDEEDSVEERSFTLYRLAPETLKTVTDNHIAYCLKTGAPLNHGDPIRPKAKTQGVKASPEEISASLPSGVKSIDVVPRLMAKVNDYYHSINPFSVTGEYVTTVKQSDFSNYLVPHSLETN